MTWRSMFRSFRLVGVVLCSVAAAAATASSIHRLLDRHVHAGHALLHRLSHDVDDDDVRREQWAVQCARALLVLSVSL